MEDLLQGQEAVLDGKRKLLCGEEHHRVLAELGQDVVQGEQRAERVSVRALVARQQEAITGLKLLGHLLGRRVPAPGRAAVAASLTGRAAWRRGCRAPGSRRSGRSGWGALPRLARDASLEHPVGRREPGERRLALRLAAEHADANARRAQVRACLHRGHRHESILGSSSSVAIADPITSRITSLTSSCARWAWSRDYSSGMAACRALTTWAISATDVRRAQQVALERAPSGQRDSTNRSSWSARPHLPTADQCADEGRPLPGVVAIDLGDRGPEALPSCAFRSAGASACPSGRGSRSGASSTTQTNARTRQGCMTVAHGLPPAIASGGTPVCGKNRPSAPGRPRRRFPLPRRAATRRLLDLLGLEQLQDVADPVGSVERSTSNPPRPPARYP